MTLAGFTNDVIIGLARRPYMLETCLAIYTKIFVDRHFTSIRVNNIILSIS